MHRTDPPSAPPGRLIWITGLSGAGKTTVAHLLQRRLLEAGGECVLLDGDQVRALFGHDLGHTPAERERAAWRNARCSAALAATGVDVICATISMFEGVRSWLREVAPGYCEVWLRVPESERARRDPKGLYAAGEGRGEALVGRDQRCELPTRPDLTVDNHGASAPEAAVQRILTALADRRRTAGSRIAASEALR